MSHLLYGRGGIDGALCLRHFSLHFGSLDDGQRVASLDEVALLHSEFENASGYFARHTVLFDLHLTLYHFRLTVQCNKTDESHNDYYC